MCKLFTFYLLAIALTLSLLECAPLKRKRGEDEEGAGGGCCGGSGSGDEDKNQKTPKVTSEEVVVPERHFLALNDDSLAGIASFGLGIQSLLRGISKSMKDSIDATRPLQQRLGADLNIPLLSNLPHHPDLLLLDEFRFPKTSQGSVDALLFAYKLAKIVLNNNSALREGILSAVFHEAAKLAEADVEAFKTFASLSNVCTLVDSKSLLINLLETNNLSGYVAWKRACSPYFQKLTAEIIEHIPLKYVPCLAAFLKEKPTDFTHLFDGKLTALSLLTLFSTELPQEVIFNVIRPWLKDINFKDVCSLLLDTVRIKFPELPLPQEFYEKMVTDTLVFATELHTAQHVEGCDCRKLAYSSALLLKARFLERALAKNPFTDYEPGVFDLDRLRVTLPLTLIIAQKYEEAMLYLPEGSEAFLEAITHVEDFSSQLAQSNPEWIRRNFIGHEDLLYRNRNLLFAFYGVSTLDQFLGLVPQEQLWLLKSIVYEKGSLEEAQLLVDHVQAKSLQSHFLHFTTLKMPADRFMAILQMLLHARHADPAFDYVSCNIKPSAKLFLLLFGEDSPVRDELLKDPFGCRFRIQSGVLAEMLNSFELRQKLFAARAFLLARFGEAIRKEVASQRSPFEIMHGSAFLELDPTLSLTLTFKSFVRDFYMYETNDFYDLVIAIFGLRKTLDLIDRDHVDQYAIPGYLNGLFRKFQLIRTPGNVFPHTEELLTRFYSAASERQKMIIESALCRAECTKTQMAIAQFHALFNIVQTTNAADGVEDDADFDDDEDEDGDEVEDVDDADGNEDGVDDDNGDVDVDGNADEGNDAHDGEHQDEEDI